MTQDPKTWDGERVRKWLNSRVEAAGLEAAAADRRGYAAQDDYDKAVAEAWVCRTLATGGRTDDQEGLAAHIKQWLAEDDYPITGTHDDRRSDRYVRANLRKIAKMVKANEGFANTLRYQG